MSDGPSRDTGEFVHDLYDTSLLYGLGQGQRISNQLQWEQINLLREARGLPPLPPIQYGNPYVGVVRFILWAFFIMIVGGIILGALLTAAG